MHEVLRQLLQRLELSAKSPPDEPGWLLLLDRLERAFADHDLERYSLEKSEAIAATEFEALRLDLRRRMAMQPDVAASSSVSPLALENQRLLHRVAELSEQLEATEERALTAEKVEAIGRLTGGVAHDFNNILCVIQSSSRMLAEDGSLSDRVKEEVVEIERAATRATALTSQLLTFGRTQPVQRTRVNLNATIVEMESMLQRLMGDRVRCRVVLKQGLGGILADPSQLQQVVLNLVINARDAIDGVGEVLLETDLAEVDVGGQPVRHAVLRVRDTGIGMSEQLVARIFEPFFTTKDHGRGTGLGLATVYAIVRQHGGQVLIDSAPGTGSTFSVLLPSTTGDEAPTPPPRPVTGGGTETILLVDDDPFVRASTARLLRRRGYIVVEAGSAERAQAEAVGQTIDLLVTDVNMPDMFGPQLAARLAHRISRVLFMSGYMDPDGPEGAAIPEAAAYIQKPFPAALLYSRVRAILDGRSVTPHQYGRS